VRTAHAQLRRWEPLLGGVGAAGLRGSHLSRFPRSLLLQSLVQGACFCSQYPADARMSRQEFRVGTDYPADLCRSLYIMKNVLLEQRLVLLVEFSYFNISEYSHHISHGIPLFGIRVRG